MTTLHVTNGDSVAGKLLQAGLPDTVLPWRDVLHDGPVPSGLDAAALRTVRAQFIAERRWAPFATVLADMADRDAQLAAAGADDSVVLWFEPDLYDQLQLLQILAYLYVRPVAERPALTIVAADGLLGTLPAGELATLANRQRAVREADLELAAAGWEAFTHSEPFMLHAFAQTETARHAANSYASDATVVLPYVHAAVRRLLEEYPSATNGLSRTEQQLVNALLHRSRTVAETYLAAHGPNEDFVWLGDSTFAWYVERLMQGPVPLLEFADGDPVAAGDARAQGAPDWNRVVRLTDAGREVARGQRHAVELNGIDRWIGGVRLTNREVE